MSNISSKNIRIGFVYIDHKIWTGGYNYYNNLFSALSKYATGEITPVLFVPETIEIEVEKHLSEIAGLEVVKIRGIENSKNFIALCKAVFLGCDPLFSFLFTKYKIDIFFENALFIGWRIDIPVVAWIPDLQHKYLPQYFSKLQLIKREIGFRAQIFFGRHIILSSYDAKISFERFYSISPDRVSVVRFAVPIKSQSPIRNDVKQKYGLRDNYIYMPNQFWQHKNHELVLEALKIINQTGKHQIQVVSSGHTVDKRHPQYFARISAKIKEYGLTDDFKILGLVPRDDVYNLIENAYVVMNPSLFEGWSTTVEEFRSSSTLMLLSDIGVHREQMGDDAIYFNPHSAHDLVQKLIAITQSDLVARVVSCEDNESRMRRFADDFVSAIYKVFYTKL